MSRSRSVEMQDRQRAEQRIIKMNAMRRYAHPLIVGPYVQDIATKYTGLDGLIDGNVLDIACLVGIRTVLGTTSGIFTIDGDGAGGASALGASPAEPVYTVTPLDRGRFAACSTGGLTVLAADMSVEAR